VEHSASFFAAPVAAFQDYIALDDHVANDSVTLSRELVCAIPEAIVAQNVRVQLRAKDSMK
jgi:hypothetical protein